MYYHFTPCCPFFYTHYRTVRLRVQSWLLVLLMICRRRHLMTRYQSLWQMLIISAQMLMFRPKSTSYPSNIQTPHQSPGQVWNVLVQKVHTKYVLVVRDLDSFTWMPNLERPVRVISYSNNSIQIVGGSVRNRTGHWRVGCYQSSMRNYVLKYEEGYHKSKNGCMFCDSLAGPFVARTDLLKGIPLDEKLPKDILFEDFFLKIKQESYLVVNCPDVM